MVPAVFNPVARIDEGSDCPRNPMDHCGSRYEMPDILGQEVPVTFTAGQALPASNRLLGGDDDVTTISSVVRVIDLSMTTVIWSTSAIT